MKHYASLLLLLLCMFQTQCLVFSEEKALIASDMITYSMQYYGSHKNSHIVKVCGLKEESNYCVIALKGGPDTFYIDKVLNAPPNGVLYDGKIYGYSEYMQGPIIEYDIETGNRKVLNIEGEASFFDNGYIFANHSNMLSIYNSNMNIVYTISTEGINKFNITYIAPSSIAYTRNNELHVYDWNAKTQMSIKNVRSISKYGSCYELAGEYVRNIKKGMGDETFSDRAIFNWNNGFHYIDDMELRREGFEYMNLQIDDKYLTVSNYFGKILVFEKQGKRVATIHNRCNLDLKNGAQSLVMISDQPYMHVQGTKRIERLYQISDGEYAVLPPKFVSSAVVDGQYVIVYENGRIEWRYRSGEIAYHMSLPSIAQQCYKCYQWKENIIMACKREMYAISITNRNIKRLCDMNNDETVAFENGGGRMAIFRVNSRRQFLSNFYKYKVSFRMYYIDSFLHGERRTEIIEYRDDYTTAITPFQFYDHIFFVGAYGIVYNKRRNVYYDIDGLERELSIYVDQKERQYEYDCIGGYSRVQYRELHDVLTGRTHKFDDAICDMWQYCGVPHIFVLDYKLHCYCIDIDKRDGFKKVETSFSDIPARYVLDGSKFICLAYDGKYIGTIDACLSAKQN